MYRYLWQTTKKTGGYVIRKTGHLFFPWITHYLTDRYQTRHHHVIVDTILSMAMIVLIAGNVGLFYWFFLFTTPANLELEISTPDYVISGSEITYAVNYKNSNKKITNLNFELLAPTGFSKKEKDVLHLNELKRNQSGNFEVKGDIIGNIQETQRVMVVVKYNYHGQSFTEMAIHNYQINDSTFEALTSLPETILNNQEFDWSVHYKNNSPQARNNVLLNLDLPSTLDITQEPENFNQEKKAITLAEVQPWAEGDISFKGVFTKALGESDTLIKVTSNLNYQEINYIQNTLEDSVKVLTPRLTVSSSAPAIANVGQAFIYQIVCNNIGDAELTNIHITTDISNISNLILSANSGSISGNQASFLIDSLPAYSKRVLYLYVNTPSGLRKENFSVSFSSQAIANIDDLTVTTYSQTSQATTKFNSTLTFETQARYFGPDNEQIGYGPYPPKADDVTALRIFWNLKDFTNDLNNVTIVTTLPSQVEWTGITSVSQGANIVYDPASRKVIWHTSYIPAFSGPQGASFEVRIAPNSQQIGKQINITNETYFSARDSFTQTILTRALRAVRTPNIIE